MTPQLTLPQDSAPARRLDAGYEWKTVTLLCLGFGLVGIDRFMILPLFPVISQELNLNYQDLGQITGVLAIAWGVAALFMGNLSDRIGHRKVIIPAVVVFSLLAGLSGLATGVGSLLLIRALMGYVLSAIGFGGTLGTLVMPALSDRLGRKPVMVLSVLGAGVGLYALMHTGADPLPLFLSLAATLFFVFSMICLTVGPISAESVPASLMSTASGIVIGTGEIFGGGIAPVIAGYVAQHYGIQYILHLAAAALAVGLVVTLLLQETAPRKRR